MFEIIQSAQAAEVLEIGNLTINVGWWPYLFLVIKYFFIFLTILFVVAIILILIRVEGGFKIRIKEAIEEAMEAGRLPKTKTQREWDVISSAVESDDQNDFKKAVILSEKLFNKVLKAANFSGSNIKERLKKIPDDQLDFKEDLIWSYKLKEKIENDISSDIDHEEAKRAVYVFQRALKEMNVL